MSDSGGADKEIREWRFYLEDMVTFAEKVRTYTRGMEHADFVANQLVYDATLRNLELIGEAATHVPEEVRSASCVLLFLLEFLDLISPVLGPGQTRFALDR